MKEVLVVKIPENAPAAKSCVLVNCSSGVFCCKRFPNPNPKKLIAKMGATPVNGADIPNQCKKSTIRIKIEK